MEVALSFLERLLLAAMGVFALYQCFQVADVGWSRRPAVGWTARICLIAFAGVCFFTLARIVGTR